MYHFVSLIILSLWLGGCGETPSNVPLAGDIEAIVVEADATQMYATETLQMSATAFYTLDVPERNVTANINWGSSDAEMASVDSAGLVSGEGAGGTVTITGHYNGFSDSSNIAVIPLVSLEINATDTNLTQEQTLRLTAVATFDDNARRDVTDAVTWVLGNAGDSNASLEQNGTLYTGDMNGILEVNVTRFDINATIELLVTP